MRGSNFGAKIRAMMLSLRHASGLLTSVIALSALACAGGTGAEPQEPRQARSANRGDDAQTEALEDSLARLERRQLEHIQRQRELEAEVAKLSERLEGRDAPPNAEKGKAPSPENPRKRRTRPDPDAVYAVPVGDSPTVGPEDAPVTIVEAFEFACPFCHRVRPTIASLREEYGDELRIVYKNFIVHAGAATTPALAACAAQNQGHYAKMHALIWERGYEENRDLSKHKMLQIARDIGLDMARFEADMDGDTCRERIREEQETLRELGTRGTPNFYINGRPLAGAQPIERFRALIDEELDKAKARIDEGTAPSDYYRTYVMEQGKASF